MNDTTSVPFTVDELWLLQGVIRHEMANAKEWKFAPVSLELNDSIARALVFCDEHNLDAAHMELSRGDLLAIDFHVPNSAKSPSGALIGKNILLKTFRARDALNSNWLPEPSAEEPQISLQDRLEEWKATDQKVHTKYRKRNSKDA